MWKRQPKVPFSFFFCLLFTYSHIWLFFFSFSGIIASERKLNKRVTTVTKSAYYPHKDISTIEDFLSKQDAEKPTHVFLFSRSDGCNGVFAALSKTSIRKLQLAQNAAARVLPKSKKLERITALLRSWHWLPVSQRTDLKMLLLLSKALNGLGAKSMQDFRVPCEASRALRSWWTGWLSVPRSRRAWAFASIRGDIRRNWSCPGIF